VGDMTANLFGPDLGIVVVVILAVIFGGSQLPKIARNIGTAGKEFRKAQQEAEEEAEKERAAKASAQSQIQPSTPALTQSTTPGSGTEEGSITLTPAQLEALLKSREEQARGGGAVSN
jgi:sec-independent protein translocase protein TatA